MKAKLLLASLLLGHFLATAQLDCSSIQYTYSTFVEEYSDLDSSMATNLTEGIVWDDPDLYFPIGFEFEFYDIMTSNLAVSGDLLGAGVVGNPDALKSDANAFLPAFADYTDLAYAQFEEGTENGISTISHVTEGEPGERIMKLEWKNVGFYYEVSDGTANNSMNAQMWLYESDQSIEFRYGPSEINDDDIPLIFDGVSGPISGLICSLPLGEGPIVGVGLDGAPAKPTLLEIDENAENLPTFSSMPESGRVYRWERQLVSVEETVNESDIQVFPNPVNEVLSISTTHQVESVQIMDMTGKVVLESALQCESCQLQTLDLAPGIYMVRMKIGEQFISKKITKA